MPYYDPNHEHFEFDINVSIGDIEEYFTKYNNNGPFFSMFETGLDGLRFDLIRVDPYRQYIRIFEFKSCRSDFISDKKWQKYLPYCHTFTFVCPREAIKREDIPKGIGLLWIFKYRWKDGGGLQKNKNWRFENEWVRRPRSKIVEQQTLTRLAFMLVHRTIWRKEAVF